MREGMLHICDVQGPKKTGSVETRLEAMEQQDFKCQGMVERGLNANHMMITEFTSKHKIDASDIGKNLSRFYDRIDQLQAQMYDMQNQNSPLPLASLRRATEMETLAFGASVHILSLSSPSFRMAKPDKCWWRRTTPLLLLAQDSAWADDLGLWQRCCALSHA
ncbi:40S ribosomal protein S5-1 [Hordeum vulgare]|nr:40S ribosomal protein S5-1 [Hordeum vulgare]